MHPWNPASSFHPLPSPRFSPFSLTLPPFLLHRIHDVCSTLAPANHPFLPRLVRIRIPSARFRLAYVSRHSLTGAICPISPSPPGRCKVCHPDSTTPIPPPRLTVDPACPRFPWLLRFPSLPSSPSGIEPSPYRLSSHQLESLVHPSLLHASTSALNCFTSTVA